MQKSATTKGGSSPLIYDIDSTQEMALWTGTERLVTNSNPSWRVLIAKKQDASMNYFKSAYEVNKIPITRCETFTKGAPGQPGTIGYSRIRWPGSFPNQEPTDAVTDDIALKRLKAKINMHTGDFNLMVPSAEIRELRGTISGAIKLTQGLIESLILIKKTKGRSAFKHASQAWLTYGFGLAPLSKDLQDLCISIDEFLRRKDHNKVLYGKATKTWIGGPVTESSYNVANAARFRSHCTALHTLSYRYTGGWNFALRSANDYDLVDHLNLGLPALVPAVWEYTAFSWVFDYFTTIGDYLEDVFLGNSPKPLYLNRTRKYEIRGVNLLDHRPLPGTLIMSQTVGQVPFRYYEFERTVLSTLPHRALRFKSVDEVSKGALNKLLNLTAVLGSGTSLFGRKDFDPRIYRKPRYVIKP